MGEGKERKRGTVRRGRGNGRGGKRKGKRKGKRLRGNRGKSLKLGGMDVGSEMGKCEEGEGTDIIKKKVKWTCDRRKSESGNGKR
jgi:hypothetical protein